LAGEAASQETAKAGCRMPNSSLIPWYMRIFVASGAPRDNGYTRDLLKLFFEGITEAGGDFDHADLWAADISPCQGCYRCWNGTQAGKCFLSDDMSELIQRYLDSRIVVFATPLYFFSFSAKLKGFIERLLPITKPSPPSLSESGLAHNSLRDPNRGPKSSILIAVAGHRDPRGMEGIVKTFNLVSEGLTLKPTGKLLRNESFFMDFPAGRPKTTARIRAAFKKAGTELATLGRISEETQKEASLPLSPDQESFDRLTSIYWKTAEEKGGSQFDRKKIRKIVSQDLSMLIPELASYLTDSAPGDLSANFLFDLSGSQPGFWHLAVAGGRCIARSGDCENPTVIIRASSETLLDIIFHRADPRQLVAKGKLIIAGDKSLFKSLARLLSTPSEHDSL
jgi:multimeric flavodoxin WrbA